ncbi:MAG: hypothetical protein KJ017_03190 [Alphaproteobacteria bacterium]|nr:hypothetical protein [Alphaproteobacteria bacterium]
MDKQKVIKYAYYVVYFLLSVLAFLIILAVMVLEANKNPDPEARKEAFAKMYNVQMKNPNLPDPWPPKMNKQFPDIPLVDQTGVEFKMADLKGKVIIVEYIDMTSPISQAYSGAKTKGTLGGTQQKFDEGTVPVEEVIKKETQGQVVLPHPDVIMVKILIYNENAKQSGPPDADRWARHFGFTREGGVIVAVPQKDMRDKKTDGLIPGFQLVDKFFDLRVDSAGPNPKHSLNFTFATTVPVLLSAEVE